MASANFFDTVISCFVCSLVLMVLIFFMFVSRVCKLEDVKLAAPSNTLNVASSALPFSISS